MAQFYSAKRRVTTRQIITVTVNDLDPFGQGVARHQGKALFVSGLLPQEQAEVVLVEDKNSMPARRLNAVLATARSGRRRAVRILVSAADVSSSTPALSCSSRANAPPSRG